MKRRERDDRSLSAYYSQADSVNFTQTLSVPSTGSQDEVVKGALQEDLEKFLNATYW